MVTGGGRGVGRAEAAGPLADWVNNAALFRDAALHTAEPAAIMDLISANLAPVVTGCAVAVRRFLAAGRAQRGRTGGSIVNVSSHQAQRAVRGALPYATAKAAIEGLTRAAAGSARPRRSPTRWRTCCPTRPASSPGRCCRWTADGPPGVPTRSSGEVVGQPSHFRVRVARCQSRNAVRVARSSASIGGVVRGGVTGPP